MKKKKTFDTLPIVELIYKPTVLTKKPLDTTKKMVKALRTIYDKKTIDLREQSVVLMFGNDLMPIGGFKVGLGDKNSVQSDFHYIFQMLFMQGAQAFVFSHNHPLSKVRPSSKDLDFTHALKLQADFLGFEFVDHIIINKKEHFSFDDNNLMPIFQ